MPGKFFPYCGLPVGSSSVVTSIGPRAFVRGVKPALRPARMSSVSSILLRGSSELIPADRWPSKEKREKSNQSRRHSLHTFARTHLSWGPPACADMAVSLGLEARSAYLVLVLFWSIWPPGWRLKARARVCAGFKRSYRRLLSIVASGSHKIRTTTIRALLSMIVIYHGVVISQESYYYVVTRYVAIRYD